MPAAKVTRNDEVEPAEGRIMNDEIAALVATAARLPAAERQELIEAISDTLDRLAAVIGYQAPPARAGA